LIIATWFLIIPSLSCSRGPGTPVLEILSFEDYVEPEWVRPFEEAHGCAVRVTYVGGVDEMYAKATARTVPFDLAFVDCGTVPRYIRAGLAKPLDLAAIPNWGLVLPAFKDTYAKAVAGPDGKPYAVPFAWGSLPMVVDASKIPEPIDSWEAMWDPKHRGKIITQDDANNQIVLVSLLLGFPDPFNLSDEQYEKVKAKLLAQKPLVRTYYSGFEEGVNIIAGGDAWLGYTVGPTMVLKLQERGVKAVEVVPKEGAPAWIDGGVLLATGRHPELAHAYLNHALSKDVQVRFVTKTKYGGVNSEAAKALPPDVLKAAHMDDPRYWDRLVLMRDVKDWDRRVALWQSVKR
jgi:putative spermidine/putrescine transport system substrate-binding protein/spermidine/putrescine transport system substrate-binding protein